MSVLVAAWAYFGILGLLTVTESFWNLLLFWSISAVCGGLAVALELKEENRK